MYAFPMFDCEAWFLKEYILGKVQLPSFEEMLENIQYWQDEVNECKTVIDKMPFLVEYMKDLVKVVLSLFCFAPLTNYPLLSCFNELVPHMQFREGKFPFSLN